MPIRDVSSQSVDNLTSLMGRVAVITGGARGLGFAISRRLAEAGAQVFIADLNEQTATQAVQRLEKDGGQAIAVKVDVTDSDSQRALAAYVMEKTGRLDIWINNAGMYPNDDTLEMSDEKWARVVTLNLTSAFFGAREVANTMFACGNGGVIVNLSSTAAHRLGVPGMAHYAASKAGIEGLTQSLAFDLAPHNIRVLAVAPTMMVTEGVREHAFFGRTETQTDFANMLPLGRVGTPDDVARVVLFCVSDLSMFMSGSTLLVDGGQLTA